MEKIAGIIVIFIVFMVPMYGILIWTYFCPEDSLLWGKRWMYKEEPELFETDSWPRLLHQ